MPTPFIRAAGLWLFLAAWGRAESAAGESAQAASDLAADPAVVWGRLDNGLRYAIRPNAEPRERVSLRLLVLAGSLQETEAERGLAHFVEHLAFNGTRRFPKKSLRGFLAEHGVARGPDLNAFTTATHTLYKLDLPVRDPARLGEALDVLREFADGVRFDPDDVETERGIVASERSARDVPAWRRGVAFRKFAFPGSPLGDREPIGAPEVIRGAQAADLKAFYDRWYRADNLVVVVVGDVDPVQAEARLRAAFASLARPAVPLPDAAPLLPVVPAEAGAGYLSEGRSEGSVTVELFALMPQPAAPDSPARRREALLRAVAFDALKARLHFVQLREARTFGAMEAGFEEFGHLYQIARVLVDANGTRWREAVRRAEEELHSALAYGFTAGELAEAVANRRAHYAFAARAAGTRPSDFLADEIASGIEDHWVFTTPATDLALARDVLAGLTPEQVLAAFRRAWGDGRPRLFVHGMLPAGIGPAQLAAADRLAAQTRGSPPADARAPKFAYASFGSPGAIVSRRAVDDLGIELVTFANGVKLNLKATPFEADSVLLSARFGTGAAGEPANRAGLRLLVPHGFAALGLGRHDRTELAHLSAGVIATLNFSVEETAFAAVGRSDRAGAERMLQLFTAYLADPGWRRGELTDIRNRVAYAYRQTTQEIVSGLALYRFAWTSGHDPRYSQPALGKVCNYSVADLRAWLGPQLAHGPVEIGLAGDFEVDAMIALAARTVGCLPARVAAPGLTAPRFVPVPDPPAFVLATENPIGAVQVTWPAPVAHDHVTRRQVELLAEVLDNRITAQLREERGATYSPHCGVWRSELQPGTAYLIAALSCEPAATRSMAEAVRQIAAGLAQGGVTAEEFERARQPRLLAAPAQMRTNAYWIGACLDTAQSEPERLDLARSRVTDLENLTAAEISARAAEVLPFGRAALFVATPEPREER